MWKAAAGSPRCPTLPSMSHASDLPPDLPLVFPGGSPDLRADVPVRVRRSARRRRTVAARLEAGELIVMIPAAFTAAQEREWVDRMRTRVLSRALGRTRGGDAALEARARRLSERYLGGAARPVSVRWVDNQSTRWGSATPARGTIRLNRVLATMPRYVVDYVLLHELAHLIQADHGPRFWRLLEGYPSLDRARGYLDGYAAGRGWATDSPGEGETPQDEGGDDLTEADVQGAQ